MIHHIRLGVEADIDNEIMYIPAINSISQTQTLLAKERSDTERNNFIFVCSMDQ